MFDVEASHARALILIRRGSSPILLDPSPGPLRGGNVYLIDPFLVIS